MSFRNVCKTREINFKKKFHFSTDAEQRTRLLCLSSFLHLLTNGGMTTQIHGKPRKWPICYKQKKLFSCTLHTFKPTFVASRMPFKVILCSALHSK